MTGVEAIYEQALVTVGGPVSGQAARWQKLATAARVPTDIEESMRAGQVWVDEQHILAHNESELQGGNSPHLRESLMAGVVLFDLVPRELIRASLAGEDLGRRLGLVLHQSLATRLSEETESHSGRLLRQVHLAQTTERARIVRELQDRVGFWLTTAYRQLELFDMAGQGVPAIGDSGREAERLLLARGAAREAMGTLRSRTSELRIDESIKSLKTALLTAFAALSTDEVSLRLNINGDETWALRQFKDETFLILREAVRDAIVHGRLQLVVVSVHIALHELRVFVDDDGRGFDIAADQGCGEPEALDGVGLSNMRERTEMMNGGLTISTAPGRGTHVKLFVPFSDCDDD